MALPNEEEIGLPGLVAMELVQGCKNQREQRLAQNRLAGMPLFWLT